MGSELDDQVRFIHRREAFALAFPVCSIVSAQIRIGRFHLSVEELRQVLEAKRVVQIGIRESSDAQGHLMIRYSGSISLVAFHRFQCVSWVHKKEKRTSCLDSNRSFDLSGLGSGIQLNYALPNGMNGGLSSVINMELVKDVSDMIFDGLFRKVKIIGNLFVGFSFSYQPQDGDLPIREV